MHQKLQRLTQESIFVEDYHKEMETTIIRANIDKDPETTMARFLSGLNWEIANIVELIYYTELEDMVHMIIKVERKLKHKGSTRGISNSTLNIAQDGWERRRRGPK